jgi:hypothetical protein
MYRRFGSAMLAVALIAVPLWAQETKPDLDSIELDLRTMLRQWGSPAGSHVSIRHLEDSIQVEGKLSSRRVIADISKYADSVTRVVAHVRLDAERSAGDASPAFQAWVDHTFLSEKLRSTFALNTRQRSATLEERVEGLSELASRYPLHVESKLTEDNRRKFHELAIAQYHDVTEAYEALEQQLAPLAGTVNRPTFTNTLPEEWRSRAARSTGPSKALDESLNALLSANIGQRNPKEVSDLAKRLVRPALGELGSRLTGVSAPMP